MSYVLTFHQYKLLEILAQRSRWTLKDIAQILQVSKSAACKCVQRLERRGVIQKEVEVEGSYYMIIRITQVGRRAMKWIALQEGL